MQKLATVALVALLTACGGGQPKPAASAATAAAACSALAIPAPVAGTATATTAPTPGYALAPGAEAVGIATSGPYVWVAETATSHLVAIRTADGSQRDYHLPFSKLGFDLAV